MFRIQQFRQQHVSIVETVKEISDFLDPNTLVANIPTIVGLLIGLTGKITVHLEAEDGSLYPRLIRSTNPLVCETARKYQEEMGGLKDAYVGYVEKWRSPMAMESDPHGFIAETRGVFEALAERISREEQELYRLADHLEELELSILRMRQFRYQHVGILETVKEISDHLNPDTLVADIPTIVGLLIGLTGKILVHLEAEDGSLYPRLVKSTNPLVSETARKYQYEMGGLKDAYVGYFEKWRWPEAMESDPHGFIAATRGVFEALAERISREDHELYSLADHLDETGIFAVHAWRSDSPVTGRAPW